MRKITEVVALINKLSAVALAGAYARIRDDWRELESRKEAGEDVAEEIDRTRAGLLKVRVELGKFERVE